MAYVRSLNQEEKKMTMFEDLKAVLDGATTKVSLIHPDEQAVIRLKEVYPFNEETFFGAVLSKTGGIVIDDWIRIYGSGKYDFYKKNTSLSEWGAMIIAEDIVGGLFSLDNNGIINYFAPDSLQWESLDITYSQFIHWATIKERVDKYYETFRWDGWAEDSAMLSSTQGMICIPPLWTKECKTGFSTKPTPMHEILELQLMFSKEL